MARFTRKLGSLEQLLTQPMPWLWFTKERLKGEHSRYNKLAP
jgi:hypothetical protein